MTKDEILQEKSAAIRKRSGGVGSEDPLVVFLYLLARDQLPVGAVEALLGEVEVSLYGEARAQFSNGWLTRWAQDAAERLS